MYEKIFEIIVSEISDIAFNKIKSRFQYDQSKFRDLHLRLRDRARYAYNWSENIYQFGWPSSIKTQNATIPLTVNRVPRKFTLRNTKSKIIDEVSVKNSSECIIVLGDPGAGKTTTIKRFIRDFYTDSGFDQYQYPILIRASEIEEDIFSHIADLFGIYTEDVSSKVDERGSKIPYDYKYQVSGISLKIFVIDFLRASNAYLFIDGIDEVKNHLRDKISNNLSEIALHKDNYGLMATCRSGDFTHSIDGMLPLEISPLSKIEQSGIIDRWCENPDLFNRKIKIKPYKDLLDRPLFLVNLVNIFNIEEEHLPDKPSDIYDTILSLSLERWDRERSIKRQSKYAGFSTRKKLDFLSSFSYNLLITMGQISFSFKDFETIYKKIHANFGLPEDHNFEVATEIESHTGIIIQNSYNTYSFAHLSILEYLSAYYILREASFENIKIYLKSNPSIVAIATSISPNPNRYLIHVLSSSGGNYWLDNAKSFFSRLHLEYPYLNTDAETGLHLMNYIIKYYEMKTGQMGEIKDREVIDLILSINGVCECICEYFSHLKYSHALEVGESQSSRDYHQFDLTKAIEAQNTSRVSSVVSISDELLRIINRKIKLRVILSSEGEYEYIDNIIV